MLNRMLTVTNPKAAPATFLQDPSASLNYAVEWSGVMGGGITVFTRSWASSPAGLTVVDTGVINNTRPTCEVSGGVAGQTYRVTSHVVDTNGDTDEQSFFIKIQDT